MFSEILSFNLESSDFDLDKVLKYKPFFFFWNEDYETTITHNLIPIHLKFKQKDRNLKVFLESEKDISRYIKDIRKRLEYILGLYEEYRSLEHIVENDHVLKKFKNKIYGNRIISAYNDFDAVLAIIVSQNMTFNQYKKVMRNIIKEYGYIPTAFDILKHPKGLTKAGVGYRDKFILNAATKLRFNKNIELEDLNIKGIGNYSKNIFVLFQKRKWSYFYVDTLIKRIFKEKYDFVSDNDREIRDFAMRRFGDYSGMIEVYLQKFLNDN